MRRTSTRLSLRPFPLPVSLFAQSQATTGVIEGTVVDATGAVLPGVTVLVENTATNSSRSQVTDRAGRIRGVLLPLGPYRSRRRWKGSRRRSCRGLDLGVGQTLTVNDRR